MKNDKQLSGVLCNELWTPEVQMKNVFVKFDNERIDRIIPWEDGKALPQNAIIADDKLVAVPGLIDIHVHGNGGGDFLDNTDEALYAISDTSARGGATSVIATMSIAGDDTNFTKFEQIVKRLKNTVVNGSRFAGLHLEGPYINPERRGSFSDRYMRPLKAEELNKILDICADFLRKITICPELDGAWDLVDLIVKRTNAEISLGHSIASYEKAEELYQHPRVRQATHCFNAMVPLHHRAPGLLGASLLDRRVTTEMIPDGYHLSGPIIDMIYRLKGRDKAVIITDGNAATGLHEGQIIECLGGKACVKNDAVYIAGTDTLAGSNLLMARGLYKAQILGHIPFQDALTMCTYNAAKAIHMDDVMGTIEPGKLADMALIKADGTVATTIRDGKIVYSAE